MVEIIGVVVVVIGIGIIIGTFLYILNEENIEAARVQKLLNKKKKKVNACKEEEEEEIVSEDFLDNGEEEYV